MALSAAAIAKILASTLGDKDNRKKLYSLMSVFPMLLIFIIAVFIYLISGLLGLLEKSDIQTNWGLVRNNITDVFSSIDYSANNNIKNTVYEFMPEFSVNLSKAAISENYDSVLLLYDTAEVQKAQAYMSTAAQQIREISDEASFKDYLSQSGIHEDFSFSDFQSEAFVNDSGIDNITRYNDTIKTCLNELAEIRLTNYRYECFDYTTADGKNAHKQILTVRQPDGSFQKVQYITIGAVNLYLPEFLALYQVRLAHDSLLEENGKKTDEDIEAAMKPIADAESEDELEEGAEEYDRDISSKLNIMEIASLKGILTKALNGGRISATTKITQDENDNQTLTITLEAPDDKEWAEVFEIDDELTGYVEEFQNVIENILTENDIPTSDMWLSLDGMFQSALFVYFEGFFNLPVDSTELRNGTNGVLSVLGEVSPIHKAGHASISEQGITLDLQRTGAPVMIDLLPSVGSKCFDDIYIYDIWDAEDHPAYAHNYLFGADAITIAYVIDTEVFRKTYGFDFPIITDGVRTLETEDSTITMLVEYACLSDVTLDESYIGESIIDDVLAGHYIIGYSHNAVDEDKTVSFAQDFYYHECLAQDDPEYQPHICINVDFRDGLVNSQAEPGDNYYNGVSGTNEHRIYSINPLLWFKSFRTETIVPANGG